MQILSLRSYDGRAVAVRPSALVEPTQQLRGVHAAVRRGLASGSTPRVHARFSATGLGCHSCALYPSKARRKWPLCAVEGTGGTEPGEDAAWQLEEVRRCVSRYYLKNGGTVL